jgi:hypothetical protein
MDSILSDDDDDDDDDDDKKKRKECSCEGNIGVGGSDHEKQQNLLMVVGLL